MLGLKNRLVVKLSLSVLVLLILLFSALIFVQVQNTKQASEQAIGSFNMHMAEAYAEQFDLKSYEAFLQAPEENDLYWTIREEMNQYRARIGAMYVYTVQINDKEEPILLIDGQPRGSDSASPIGEVTDMPKQAIEAVLNGELAKTGVIRNPEYGNYLSSYAPLRDADGKVIGVLGIDTSVSVANSIYRDVIRGSLPVFVMMGTLALLAFAVIAWLMFRALRPLNTVVKGADAIARGDFAEAKAHLGSGKAGSKDEIGQAYAAMIRMADKLGETLGDVVRDMGATAKSLVESTGQFGSESERMLELNRRLEQSVAELADGTKHQRIGAEESAKSMAEMAAAIGRIAEASAAVTEASSEALASAEQGKRSIKGLREQVLSMSEAVTQTSESVRLLQDCMQEIEPALAAISEISNQTKLLALNASIEAARAGEHGSGFAVVAGEVRKLADSSVVAVERVAELLLQIREESDLIGGRMRKEGQEVARGVDVSGEAEKLFELAMDRFVLVNGQIQDVSAASQEMLAGSEEVAASVEQIASITQEAEKNTDAIREMSAQQLETATRIAGTTGMLKERSAGLEAAVEKFKL